MDDSRKCEKKEQINKEKKNTDSHQQFGKSRKALFGKTTKRRKETAIAPITVTIIYSIYHPDMQRNGENWPLMNKKKEKNRLLVAQKKKDEDENEDEEE